MVNKNIRDMCDHWCGKIRFMLEITHQEQVDWLPELKHTHTLSAIIRGQIPQNLGAASGRDSVFTAENLPSMAHMHNLLPSRQVYTFRDVHHSSSQIHVLSDTFNGSHDKLNEKWHAAHDLSTGAFHIQFLLSYFVILFLYLGEGLKLDAS